MAVAGDVREAFRGPYELGQDVDKVLKRRVIHRSNRHQFQRHRSVSQATHRPPSCMILLTIRFSIPVESLNAR